MKRNAGKMSNLATCPLPGILVGILEAFMYLKIFERPATIKRFNGRRRESPYPERNLLQWRPRILRLFQNQDRTFRQGQFTSEKKSNRACAGDDHVVN